MHIPAQKYITNGDMSGASVSGPIVATGTQRRVSFAAQWSSASTPVGVFTVQMTDDPLAVGDKQNGTSLASWTNITIPVGSYHGTDFSVSGTNITTVGAGGSLVIDLENPLAFTRLVYTRSSGGATNQLQARVSGSGT